MSTQQLLRPTDIPGPDLACSSDPSRRARSLAWTCALCVLAVGPGAFGYTPSTLVAEATVAALFVWAIGRGDAKRTPIDALAIVWLLSQAAATILSYKIGLGNHSPYPADVYAGGPAGPIHLLVDTAAALMAAYAMLWTARSEGLRRVLPLVAASAAVALFCIVEELRNVIYGTPDPRIQATFTNPNLLGAFLCIALPLLTAVGLKAKAGRPLHAAVWTLASLLCVALLLTQSRGALLGCAIGVACVLGPAWIGCAQTDEARARRRKTAIRAIGLGCAATVCIAMLVLPRVLHQSRTVSDDQRQMAWIAAVTIIRLHPILGAGVDSFPAAMAALGLKELNPETPSGYPMTPAVHLHAHDLFLQAWVERGLVGAAAVCLLVFLIVRRAGELFRADGIPIDPVACGAVGAIVATLIQNITDYTLWYAPIAILFWMTVGLVFSSE